MAEGRARPEQVRNVTAGTSVSPVLHSTASGLIDGYRRSGNLAAAVALERALPPSVSSETASTHAPSSQALSRAPSQPASQLEPLSGLPGMVRSTSLPAIAGDRQEPGLRPTPSRARKSAPTRTPAPELLHGIDEVEPSDDLMNQSEGGAGPSRDQGTSKNPDHIAITIPGGAEPLGGFSSSPRTLRTLVRRQEAGPSKETIAASDMTGSEEAGPSRSQKESLTRQMRAGKPAVPGVAKRVVGSGQVAQNQAAQQSPPRRALPEGRRQQTDSNRAAQDRAQEREEMLDKIMTRGGQPTKSRRYKPDQGQQQQRSDQRGLILDQIQDQATLQRRARSEGSPPDQPRQQPGRPAQSTPPPRARQQIERPQGRVAESLPWPSPPREPQPARDRPPARNQPTNRRADRSWK